MTEPVNRWQPVTSEYQEELEPRPRRSLRDRLWKRAARSGDAGQAEKARKAEKAERAESKAPAGILGIIWFYLLNAAAYFVSGSVLLSFPLSDTAYKLMRHGHAIVPFPVRQVEDIPFVNVLAESLFIMAVVSAAVAVLWMARFRAARWITLCYAGAWLVRNAVYLFAGRLSLSAAPLAAGSRQVLLADSIAEALIFLYLLVNLRGAREGQKLRT
jgi:hypothetical protein